MFPLHFLLIIQQIGPFAENELFTVSDFFAHKEELCIIDQALYQGIVEKYKEYNDILSITYKPFFDFLFQVLEANYVLST